MKRLLLFLSTILTIIAAQAQTPYLKTGDIVSIHYGYWEQTSWYPENVYEYRTNYMEASNSGIKMVPYATDDCLWELTVENNVYAFKDLTTGKYLKIKDEISQESALILADNASAFYFTDMGGEKGKYMFGQLYYNTVTPWGSQIALLMSQYQDIFMVAGWNPSDLYIEKWEQKGAGKPTGHFNPSKIEFTYAADSDAAAAQARDVSFMIEATTESYYKCIRRPDEALLRRSTGDVDESQIRITNIYWQSDSVSKSSSVSKLDKNNYVNCPETHGREVLSRSEYTYNEQDKKWQFTITPVGASPMGLKDKLGTQTRWIDYADNVVVEYTYGGGETQTAEMRVVRKAYHEKDLPTLTFSINPVTYTFTKEEESKVFDVVATHQHGRAIFNVDSQIVDTTFTLRPEKIALTAENFELTDDTDWLTAERYGDYKIRVTATENNTNTKRSATLTGTLHPQQGEDHSSVSFTIPLYQRGEHGGIQFEPNMGAGNTGFEKNPHDNRNQQKVHTAERTIYYLPNQEIELRLPEAGFSGYMRWYDYETNGDPYYNENPVDSTDWIRSPRAADGTPFFAINTPKDASDASQTADGISYGLYAINKDKDNNGSDAAIGGILNEENTNNQAPILKGWDYSTSAEAYHTIACDVSAYTDYEVNVTSGKIVSIKEPTLSYRQLFHLRPAEEMADTLKARSERGVYLEEYKYQAPAGKQILLATQYRYKKARSHASEMCYFYKANWGGLYYIDPSTPVVWKEYNKNADGTLTENTNFRATYSAEMDYLIVRSDVYPATKVYTLVLPRSEGWMHADYTTDLLIARFEVEFVDIEKQGPTNKTIITQQRINTQYKNLAEINFDNTTSHLPWEQASYGYVYTEGNLATQFKRGANQGAFPFYGEYIVTENVDKDWARASAHGGTGKALYVDGTMEPGLVASITAPAKICSGQTMYCSAWLCNPAPSGWSGEGNPIFRCNIQGKNTNETEWHDAGVYFAGELLKGTGWQQIVFPIQSAASYDSTRVSIYNFATTNQGNDFMVDDITLYVSQLPIAAYQGKMACRTTGDATTSAAAILRLDYSNINAGSDGYMYYQIYNESFEGKANPNDPDTIGGYPVNLTGEAAYYHDNNAHTEEDHAYGSVTIPAADYNPESDNKVLDQDYFYSVSRMLDYMAEKDLKKFKAYVKTENSGVVKWLLYVAHFVQNVSETDVNDNKNMPLQALYDQHEYTMRMAYSPGDLSQPACNLQTPLHATQKTVFRLRNSDGDVIKHDNDHQATKGEGERDINRVSTLNCANDLYFLTAKIINNLSLGGAGGSLTSIEAPIYADWLVGEDFDDVYNDGRPETGSEEKTNADAAFKAKYGYTRGQIASAVMYDMRRIPTDDEPNPNYTARSLKELQPSAFESYQNYEIVKHLCDSGWLQMYDTTVHFYLGSNEKARYWCFPIEGTAKYNETVTLKDCNEPRWVSISSQESDYYLNLAPIKNSKKTNQQKTQIPAVKVLEGSTEVAFSINELSGTWSGSGREQTFTPNIEVGNTNTINGESFVRLDLKEDCELMDMELGRPSRRAVPLNPGQEYTVRMTLTETNGYEYPGNNKDNCRVGYVFVTLQVVPKNLVWSPDEISFTGWGLNDNWKGWSDKNDNGQVDEGELVEGFVPISGANVIIPKLDNPLAYPYIVHEGDTEHGHKHNHYPMTIDFQPHHCNYIYFAPGAKLHNQHVLQYKKAFVDMQVTAGAWNMVSAPLQGMVSGDMFIPHNGWWSSAENNLIAESNPFEVSSFQGIRSGDAAYAFWQAFYNTTVNKMTNNGLVDVTAGAEFVQSNTLIQELNPGAGYQLYGLGWKDKEALTIRLPKPDTGYKYYNSKGEDYGDPVQIPTANRNKLAFTPTNNETDAMDITLTNKTASRYFLFGNPTMAYINMHDFLHDNEGEENNKILNHVFYRIENGTWDATTEHTMGNDRFLAPMTSVMLEASTACTALQLTLKASHLTLNNQVSPFSEDNPAVQQAPRRAPDADNQTPTTSELLTIYALTKNATARTVLATNPMANDYYLSGEDALFISTGVENESYVTTPLNMYTVAERVPMMADVRQGISNIPLAILAADKARQEYMQLAFYYTSNWSRTCYFCDSKTGQKIRIMDGLVISVEMPQNHEQRYFIEGPDTYLGSGNSNGNGTSTAVDNTHATAASLHAYSQDKGQLTVVANQPIRELKVYSITGQLLSYPISTHNCQLSTVNCQQLPTGVCIVEATLHNGTTLHTQAIVQ